MQIANRGQIIFVSLLSLVLGLTLMAGFIPTSSHLCDKLIGFFGLTHKAPSSLLRAFAFPALALFFCVSLPSSSQASTSKDMRFVFRSLILPGIISLLYGLSVTNTSTTIKPPDWLWLVILAPMGEELLFRGWLFRLIEKFHSKLLLTLTNPLPISVWGSAFAFSLWHLQNAGNQSVILTTLQLVYTFLTGLWLGYVRWKTNKISFAILGHSFINLMCLIPQA